jgi:hypothetical protein
MDIWKRNATLARARISATYGRLYPYEALLERLSPDLQDVAAALQPCLQEEHTMVRA